MDCSLPGSSVHGILQARVLEWGAIAFSERFLAAAAAKLLQSCPTLCNPMDYSPPGSSVHGILQARILEWVAMSSTRTSSGLRDQTPVSCSSCIGNLFFFFLPLVPPRKPTHSNNHLSFLTSKEPFCTCEMSPLPQG